MVRRLFIASVLLPCFLPVSFSQTSQHLVSYAGAREPLDIVKLADRSDLIVVAEVSRLLDAPSAYFRDEESSKAKLYAAEVTIREVLKGDIPLGKIVVGGLMPISPTNRSRGGPLQANTVKIFFLNRQQNSWRFADPFFGALVAAPVTPRPSGGSAVDKVMEQLLAALKSELLSVEEKRDVISELSHSYDVRIVPTLKAELEKSRNDMLTCSLLGSLVRRGDTESVGKAKQFLASSNSPYGGLLIGAISRLNKKELLPVVIAGLQSPVQVVRISSADALAFSQLPEAKPQVLALLDDPNRRLVTQLMMTLSARYKHPEWAPEWDDDKRWEDMRLHWRQFLESDKGE